MLRERLRCARGRSRPRARPRRARRRGTTPSGRRRRRGTRRGARPVQGDDRGLVADHVGVRDGEVLEAHPRRDLIVEHAVRHRGEHRQGHDAERFHRDWLPDRMGSCNRLWRTRGFTRSPETRAPRSRARRLRARGSDSALPGPPGRAAPSEIAPSSPPGRDRGCSPLTLRAERAWSPSHFMNRCGGYGSHGDAKLPLR